MRAFHELILKKQVNRKASSLRIALPDWGTIWSPRNWGLIQDHPLLRKMSLPAMLAFIA